MSKITQRGATGPLALTANGAFQKLSQTETIYGSTATNTDLNTLLGSRWDLDDGREVRLALVGGSNIAAGVLVTAPAAVADNLELTVTAFQAYSNNGNIPAKVTVTLSSTAVTANEYRGGLMIVNSGTGLGQTLKIASHPAALANASVVITLEDGPNVALDTTSTVSLFVNDCQGIIISNHSALQQPVGVSLYAITAAYYGFVISRGVTACLNDGGWTTGSEVSPSNGTDGAVENGVIAQGFVGIACQAGTTAHYNRILVNL